MAMRLYDCRITLHVSIRFIPLEKDDCSIGWCLHTWLGLVGSELSLPWMLSRRSIQPLHADLTLERSRLASNNLLKPPRTIRFRGCLGVRFFSTPYYNEHTICTLISAQMLHENVVTSRVRASQARINPKNLKLGRSSEYYYALDLVAGFLGWHGDVAQKNYSGMRQARA